MALEASLPQLHNNSLGDHPAPSTDASMVPPPLGLLAFRGALGESQQGQRNGNASGPANELLADVQDGPKSPRDLPSFDWIAFQARFDQVMNEANQKDIEIMKKFGNLIDYFGVWASAAADFDEERSIKRIRTRGAYVQNSEQSVVKKREHYEQVVAAFKRALELLGPT